MLSGRGGAGARGGSRIRPPRRIVRVRNLSLSYCPIVCYSSWVLSLLRELQAFASSWHGPTRNKSPLRDAGSSHVGTSCVTRRRELKTITHRFNPPQGIGCTNPSYITADLWRLGNRWQRPKATAPSYPRHQRLVRGIFRHWEAFRLKQTTFAPARNQET